MILTLKQLLPLFVQIAALAVLGAAMLHVMRRILANGDIGLTEAGYFFAGCAALLWVLR